MKINGFTLIELMVVVAIIGLLATISAVSFSSSREKARIAKGASFEGQVLRSTGDDQAIRWDFDDCSGATATDSSGNGINMTLAVGMTFSANTPSGGGCSLNLNGTSQVTMTINGLTAIHTKSFWMYVTDWTVNDHIFDESTSNYNWIELYSGNNLLLGTTPSSYFTSNTKFSLNKWYFITTVSDGTNLSLYVDGSLDKSVAEPPQVPTNTFTFGNYGGGGLHQFTGNLDNFRIFNRALSGREIQQLYAMEKNERFAKK